MLQGHYTKRLF